MKTSIPGFLLTLVRARGSADRAVDMVSRRLAERVPEEIIRTLRDEADSWVRPPGVGALGPMADSCIHLRDAARPRPAGTARRLTTALGLPNVATRASEGADSRRQRWRLAERRRDEVGQGEVVTGLVGAIVLPDGTAVRGRGWREPLPPGPLPEFGLYLGKPGKWEPEWSAEWIDWPDFRTPRDADGAAAAIVRAYEQARAGRRVEVACGGGTGRTGTVIACMDVLAGCPVDDVVAWTRRNYRRHAVETPGQRRWIRWFAAQQG